MHSAISLPLRRRPQPDECRNAIHSYFCLARDPRSGSWLGGGGFLFSSERRTVTTLATTQQEQETRHGDADLQKNGVPPARRRRVMIALVPDREVSEALIGKTPYCRVTGHFPSPPIRSPVGEG